MALRATLVVLACLALTACFTTYKVDVQQGNYIDPELIARLKPGMTRSQVRFLLGTPLLADPFHPNRWDYLFLDRRRGRLKEERRLTWWFEGDKLARAVTDMPEAAPVAAAPPPPTPPPVAVPKAAPAPAARSGVPLPTRSNPQARSSASSAAAATSSASQSTGARSPAGQGPGVPSPGIASPGMPRPGIDSTGTQNPPPQTPATQAAPAPASAPQSAAPASQFAIDTSALSADPPPAVQTR